MSEIEKMYENAGVELVTDVKFPTTDVNYQVSFPPFTAEKQIKLIKWLGKRGLLNIIYSKDKNTYHLFNDRCIGAFCYDIATAIATLVQCELDFCSPEEKQQVKGILE